SNAECPAATRMKNVTLPPNDHGPTTPNSVTLAPEGERRIHHEHQKQKRTQFADGGPWIAYAFGNRDCLPKEIQVQQVGDLLVVQVRHREKVDDQANQTQDADGVAEPWSPGAKIEQYKPDNRNNGEKHGQVPPQKNPPEFYGCLAVNRS